MEKLRLEISETRLLVEREWLAGLLKMGGQSEWLPEPASLDSQKKKEVVGYFCPPDEAATGLPFVWQAAHFR